MQRKEVWTFTREPEQIKLRRLWSVDKADFVYGLFGVFDIADVPEFERRYGDGDKIDVPLTHVLGNKEWAERHAAHYGIEIEDDE